MKISIMDQLPRLVITSERPSDLILIGKLSIKVEETPYANEDGSYSLELPGKKVLEVLSK